MQKRLVKYLRLVGFSLSAVAVAICTRLAPPGLTAEAQEPRFANAPAPNDIAPDFFGEEQEDARMAALQARLDAVDVEIANLRKALEVLGPLPDHPDLFIPVALSEVEGPAAGARQAHRYSPIVRGTEADVARFHRIELASYPSNIAAEARWNALAAAGTLTSRRPGYDLLGADISLDDVSEDAALNALCVELSALQGPARVSAPIRGSR